MRHKYFLLILLGVLPSMLDAKVITWFNGSPVTYTVQKKYGTVVAKALNMFDRDMKAVTGKGIRSQENGIVKIYQLNKISNKELKSLDKLGVPYRKVILRKESFWLGVRNGSVVIVGSDGLGTAYGILELSSQAGVSPWIYWGDVTPEKQSKLTMSTDTEIVSSPSVEYRGIALNNIDWSNLPWDHHRLDIHSKKDGPGPKYYHHLFELMLRLRANLLWPSDQHGSTTFFNTRGNKEVADSFQIYVGSSAFQSLEHVRTGSWMQSKQGEYNYVTNRKQTEDYWRQRAKNAAGLYTLYAMGMSHNPWVDTSVVRSSSVPQANVLSHILDYQGRVLQEVNDGGRPSLPRLFAPDEATLNDTTLMQVVPDRMCVLWRDDNYGYLSRLSSPDLFRRKGGSGVYYHLSYAGIPHDYLWLSCTQPGLVMRELRRAYRYGARRVWIANVHDPKVAAIQLSLFMDMAWNMSTFNRESAESYLHSWLRRQYGANLGQRLLLPMLRFYHLTGIRRPEFMGWNEEVVGKGGEGLKSTPIRNTLFSADEFGNELERYLAEYGHLEEQVNEIAKDVPTRLQAAYFAQIQYPIIAASGMATKMLQAQEARMIGKPASFHRDEEALESAVKSWQGYDKIREITKRYNKTMASGKWDGNMSMSPRRLPVFDEPVLPGKLTKAEIQRYAHQDSVPYKLDVDGCVVRNACDYQSASPGVSAIPVLGHSMKAVAFPAGGSVTYKFEAEEGEVALYLAFIPTHSLGGTGLRFTVSIDGGMPKPYTLVLEQGSDDWKTAVLRGQTVVKQVMRLGAGYHTLKIQAIDANLVFDQWMVDYDVDRLFYMYPVKPALLP